MITDRKGQSSLEFLAVVSLALVIAVPFLGALDTAIQDTTKTTDGVTLKNTLDELETAINTVGIEGEPAKRTMWLDLPRDVVNSRIENDEDGEGDAIIFVVERAEGPSEVFRITQFDIEDDGDLPGTPGSHRIEVQAKGDESGNEYVSINPVN